MNKDQKEIEGVVKTITFYNEENHYAIAQVQTADLLPVTIVGQIPDLKAGERFLFGGHWENHAKYGPQFKVESFTPKVPETPEGIKKYLGSGLIKGLGPATAADIVDHFGTAALQVMEQAPDRLTEVPGIGRKKLALIKKGWAAQAHTKEIFIFLQQHNISTNLALKIYKEYGRDSVPVLKKNPYRLADDLWGVGFKTADQIARDLGLGTDSPERVQAGILYVLQEALGEGHCYLPWDLLFEKSAGLLGVDRSLVDSQLNLLVQSKKLIAEAERMYLAGLFAAEQEVVVHFRRLNNVPLRSGIKEFDKKLAALETRNRITFSDEQKQAVRHIQQHKLLVITGGPGTGKTTTLLAITRLLSDAGRNVQLAAPTGRAAKRMSDATGYPARTIHRLLEYNPGKQGFGKNELSLLDLDVLILDECSMIDLLLMRDLLCALPPPAQLILVGDQDQLPSVGPGNVFRDIIASNAVAVVNLNHIFRQAEKSLIVVNAHRINQGQLPLLKREGERNFFLLEKEDPAAIPPMVVDLITERLPKSYQYDPRTEIQVISPMYKGEVGVNRLNGLLQESLNPHGEEVARGSTRYRVGDKVMQVRNNYDKAVFNGDIGYITRIDSAAQEMLVQYDQPVCYDYAELDEITLAYAITVHKAQGSEYRAVIMPLVTQHYMMLQRNLLYTAVTRAKEMLILIGTTRALGIAVKNDQIKKRFTSLTDRLVGVR